MTASKKIPWKWEKVSDTVCRARVLGGWLVSVWEVEAQAPALAFVPDPDHTWEVDHDSE